MKAIIIRKFGPPDVLMLEEVPTPQPGPGEVLIEVKAVSVNRTLDLVVREGKYAAAPQLPHILGVDPVGVVVEVGPDVEGRTIGQRVTTTLRINKPNTPTQLLGVHVWGGYAQYVKVPAEKTNLIPDNLGFAEACVIARHAPTAFHLLRDRAKLKAGEWVLIMGAAGGLGSSGVQAAKVLNAKVIAAAGADERVKAAIDLGADAGVNYREQDLVTEVLKITGGKGVDIVFENVGDPVLFPKAFYSLGKFGRLITAGSHGGGSVHLDTSHLYRNQLTIMGAVGQTSEDVTLALHAAADGKIKALIDRVLPLKDAALAHELVEQRSGLGKIVLDPTL
jgi:NADPH:quinone reductase-like Zn-dependent oxidoreductase